MRTHVLKSAFLWVIAAMIPAAGTLAADMDSGLVAYFPLDGHTQDASGGGFHAESIGVAYGLDRHGISSRAAVIASGAYAILPQNLVSNLAGSGPITIATWVQLNPEAGLPAGSLNVFSLGGEAGGRGLTFGVQVDPSRSARMEYSHYYTDPVFSVTAVPTGTWVHIAATVAVDGTVVLYKDGAASGTAKTSPNRGTKQGFIGRGLEPQIGWFGGVDDLRIYNRVLEASDIEFLYRFESQTPEIPQVAKARAEVINGFVVGVALQYGGRGYLSPPNVRFIGGGGDGAAAFATLVDGAVSAITVTSTGSGYLSAPRVEIDPPPSKPRRATAEAQVVNGFVVGAIVRDGGSGYSEPPEVRIVGGGGVGAAARAEVVDGAVFSIVITSTGSGYTSIPSMVIAPPPSAPSLAIRVSRVMVTLGVVSGRRYLLESSFDLAAWSPVGSPFVAEADEIQREFVVAETGRFYRISEVP